MDKPWQAMTPDERFQARVGQWKSPEGVEFATPEAAQGYQRRVQMFLDAIQLRKPERIPVCPSAGFFPFHYAGVNAYEAMHDYERLGFAIKKYHADFLPDHRGSSLLYGPGKAFEILNYQLYRWAGHGLDHETHYQFVEGEYMRADEYDLLINDPTDFFLRRFLPRIFGSLDSWQKIETLTDMLELPYTGPGFAPFGLPEVQEALHKLMEAGNAALEWLQAGLTIDRWTMTTLGLPGFAGGYSKAPFDMVGDTMRGTQAILLDKFRQPKKVHAAMERMVPIAVECGVRSSKRARNPLIFMPLHKGADAFLSDKDFRTFYWPSLKAVILGMIKEGLVPYLFVEGSYTKRLDVIADPDIPAGRTLWMFDQIDLREVKKRFAGWACFGGNLPVSMMKTGTPDDIRKTVRSLIDDVGRDGGYILSTSAPMYDSKSENVRAFIETGKEYGAR